MSLLGRGSHKAAFLQLLSNIIDSNNNCQINVILLIWNQILNYLFGKNLHRQEANLQSNCQLLKFSFLRKLFPLLNHNNQLLLTLFYIAPLNFKTQYPSFELGKILQNISWNWEKSGNCTWTRHSTDMERWYSSCLWSLMDLNRESNSFFESIFFPNISLGSSAFKQQPNRINPHRQFPMVFL